jgi:hypothetical protein
MATAWSGRFRRSRALQVRRGPASSRRAGLLFATAALLQPSWWQGNASVNPQLTRNLRRGLVLGLRVKSPDFANHLEASDLSLFSSALTP